MVIKKVFLKNFRNFSLLQLSFDKKINIIYGSNAQGKTNLLEGIYVGAIGKSFKPAMEKEIVKIGEKFADIKIEYENSQRNMENSLRLFTDRKKTVFLNGVSLTKLSELLGNLKVVLFTPEELSIIKEGPGGRRKFLDIFICQMYPHFTKILSEYNKALEQKNKLLKQIKAKPELESTLILWDEQLAKYGEEIIKKRKMVLLKIMEFAKKYHLEISENKEEISAVYKTVEGEDIKTALLSAFSENREKEIAAACSIIGPHRDDIIFYINGESAKIYGSQGQQRTIVLSLKLSQKRYIFEETGENPIMLLDDITGELDLNRRKYLFSKIEDTQTFITCTETDRIIQKTGAYFEVKKGSICRKEN